MTPEKLAQAFTPLYSYQFPAWWRTQQGILFLIGTILFVLALSAFFIWYRWFYRPPLTLSQWRNRELNALAGMLTQESVNYKHFFGATTFFFKTVSFATVWVAGT